MGARVALTVGKVAALVSASTMSNNNSSSHKHASLVDAKP